MWDKVVGNDLLITLVELQMVLRLVTPLFECMGVPLVYVDQGHLVKLRARMGEYDASLWIEQASTPKLQREGDASLMEAFVRDLLPPYLSAWGSQ